MSVAGIVDSAQPQLMAAVSGAAGGNTLIVTYSDMEARAAAENMKLYKEKVMLFPSKEYVFYNIETMGRANENARLSVLDALLNEKDVTVVASIDSLMTYTADRQRFSRSVICIRPGDVHDPAELAAALTEMGYRREDMIEGAGQFAARGGIIDVFSPNCAMPVRIEFWDDEID